MPRKMSGRNSRQSIHIVLCCITTAYEVSAYITENMTSFIGFVGCERFRNMHIFMPDSPHFRSSIV